MCEMAADRGVYPPELWRAFVLTPFVATGAWYLSILGALALANGQLRWKPDVLAIGLGAVVYGLPTAAVITVAVAVPGFLIISRMRRVTLWLTLAAGAVIGYATWIVFWSLTGESTVLSPVRAPLTGMVAAATWWWMGGKQPGEAASTMKRRE